MIVVWGSADDPPVGRVLEVLCDRDDDVAHIGGSDLEHLRFDVSLATGPRGWIEIRGRRVPLEQIDGMYLRPPQSAPGRARAASAALSSIAADAPFVVVNRPWAGRSNWSKPLQLRLIAEAGLAVPDTLVTSDPEAALGFLHRHDRVVYKSVSGVRSVVATIGASSPGRLDRLRPGAGPVQLQRWIDGTDVRVHVVGDQWFATRVESSAIDYRYAAIDGDEPEMSVMQIPDRLGAQLVALTATMGLLLAGIDLRVTGDGAWYCFEVNPSPGFTFYEEHTGQPIGEAIADALTRTPSR